jgi:hypothetical protein
MHKMTVKKEERVPLLRWTTDHGPRTSLFIELCSFYFTGKCHLRTSHRISLKFGLVRFDSWNVYTVTHLLISIQHYDLVYLIA